MRKEKYGKPDKYELGEILLFDKPYLSGKYTTNQEIQVKSLAIEIKTFNKGENFKCYVINREILVLYKGQSAKFKVFKKI